MKVFLLSGKAQAGKDEFFKQQQLPNSIRCAYADLLKDIAKTLGWDGKKDDKGRKFLQNLGETVRGYNENFWVKKMIEKINELEWATSIPDYIFITDCRYPNEIEEMKKHFDCVTIRIERPNFYNGLTEEQKKHASETALDGYKFDYTLFNDSTLEHYGIAVNKLVMGITDEI